MAKPRAIGSVDAVSAFEALRPCWRRLKEMQASCEPFNADHLAIGIALAGFAECAEHFTGRRHFFEVA